MNQNIESIFLPMIDVCMSFHLEVLSPNQCPVYLPLEGKVDREMTTPRFPVAL